MHSKITSLSLETMSKKLINLALLMIIVLASFIPNNDTQASSRVYVNPIEIGNFSGEICFMCDPISQPVVIDDRLYFAANDEQGLALWVSDGTLAGTEAYYHFPNPTQIGNFGYVINGKIIFSAYGGIFVTDGTPEGTSELQPVYPVNLTIYKDLVYFWVQNGSTYQAWRTDGTPEGTFKLRDFEGDSRSFHLPYILASDFVGNYYLWYTDGTLDGTVQLMASRNSFSVEPISDQESLIVNKNVDTQELWTTDNTPTGTVKIYSFTDPNVTDIGILGSAKGLVYLTVFIPSPDSSNPATIWQTDGTTNGTEIVDPNFKFTYAIGNFFCGDFLIFAGEINDYDDFLFSIKGKGSGGIIELTPTRGYNNLSYTIFNDKYYYLDPYQGHDVLFVTDGITAEPIGGEIFTDGMKLTTTDYGLMVFQGYSSGSNIYYSDGTFDETQILLNSAQLYAVTSSYIFYKTGYSTNIQLWVTDIERREFIPLVFR
jgi:hypothetical protein